MNWCSELAPATADDALAAGLSANEFTSLKTKLGRVPNYLELQVISALWSEHCSYKSSKAFLSNLPTRAPWVLQGPGENAGAVTIGDGLAVVFKIESHNHPSQIEPFQGAATGVGGILRDIFTMGARPIAILNVLRFGDSNHTQTPHFLSRVVAGIGHYGNCIGIPTVGGSTQFDSRYQKNILVNAMAVGLCKESKLCRSAAKGIGNLLVYVGAPTGRDGIHGASMASQSFAHADSADETGIKTTVQVADPFLGKCLLEACLELNNLEAIVAVQDMGAAGLTSSSAEMAAKGSVGIKLNLDQVPTRTNRMTPTELMLSESQERMLLVVKPEKMSMVSKIFAKWELSSAVIGEVRSEKGLKLFWKQQQLADLPLSSFDAPDCHHPVAEYVARPKLSRAVIEPLSLPPISQALLRLASMANLADVRSVYQQYDWLIGGNTIFAPGSTGRFCADAAVIAVSPASLSNEYEWLKLSPTTPRFLAMTVDSTTRYVLADPESGSQQCVAESFRNLCAVGAKPLALTDNLNFGNPQKPQVMSQLVAAVRGIATAASFLNTPVVSGNVSLYNETDQRSIPPTPVIGAVGLLEINDPNESVESRGYACAQVSSRLYLIGQPIGWLGCSLWAEQFVADRFQIVAPPPVDLKIEKQTGECIRQLIRDRLLCGCHDVSDGGLAVCLAELLCTAKLGAKVSTPVAFAQNNLDRHRFWFGEEQARYLVTVPPSKDDLFLRFVQATLPETALTYLGQTDDQARLTMDSETSIPLPQLQQAFLTLEQDQ